MAKKRTVHVSLEPTLDEVLDAIAGRMAEDDVYPRPSRSDLLNKAVQLYIRACKERPHLRETIEAVQARQLAASKVVPLSSADRAARPGKQAGPRIA